ncbi:UNVERIFIED_CONTAM: hypothetical protein FKN15_008296 [Acipenser sinensis]
MPCFFTLTDRGVKSIHFGGDLQSSPGFKDEQGRRPSEPRPEHAGELRRDEGPADQPLQPEPPGGHPQELRPPDSSKSAAGDHAYKESTHSKSPMELDFSSHGSNSPVPSTSLISGGLSTPNFPPALHSKPSMVQQKPTAYVRPMDGQDQVPNDSPELKPAMEIGDSYSNPPFGGLLEGKASATNAKSKLPKLTLPQSGEVGAVPYFIALLLIIRSSHEKGGKLD